MFLLIDNYDSFTWNLYQAMASHSMASHSMANHSMANHSAFSGANAVRVVRNDKISLEDALGLQPRGIVISPGPGRPDDAGISLALVAALLKQDSPPALLGVCLGMQCLAQSCGAKVVRAQKLMHGKTSRISHDGENPLFRGIPQTFSATRYHSLVVEPSSIPADLRVDAYSERTDDDQERVVMALSHKSCDLFGVQFHPESIACEHGLQLIANFITFCLNR